MALVAPGAPVGRPQPRLEGFYDRWLDSVAHLVTEEERAVFTGLRRDLERELFMRSFWEARGPAQLERYRRNTDAALELRQLAPDKHRAVLIAGKPSSVDALPGCRSAVRHFEIWHYDAWSLRHQTGESGAPALDLLFVQESNLDPRSFRLWSEDRGTSTLTYDRSEEPAIGDLLDQAVEEGCLPGPARDRLEAVMASAPGATELLARLAWALPAREWLESFRGQASALLPGAPVMSGVELELDYPGRFGELTILRGRITVPVERLERFSEDQLLDRLTIIGDLYQRQRLAETFQVVHHIAGAVPRSPDISIDFYRKLRSGEYQLRLRVADRADLGVLRENHELAVPAATEAAPAPAGHRHGLSGLTRSEVIVLTTLPSVEILPPDRTLLAEEVELQAITTGGPIGSVRFMLDGVVVGQDREPPFTVRLELGSDTHELLALALDPAERELARDARMLERESRPFWVELGSPVADGEGRHLPVEISVPDNEALVRVDCYLGETQTAALSSQPYRCPLAGGAGERLAFVRAVATLESGGSVEDVFFLSPRKPEEIEVRLVELYVSVLDQQGGPVTGLGVQDFQVLEDGAEQEILKFDTLQNLPINVAVLMDTSSSMGSRVRLAAASAQRFFRNILTPDDLAALLAFNHDVRLLVPWTGEVEWLGYGASGLRAWGSTRLHDSVIYAVHLFGGLKSRRALVVLTDGSDVESDFAFEQVLQWVVRAGVAVYPIAFGEVLPATLEDLGRLAEETGGSRFAVRGVGELDSVYRRIEEVLRSQYLVVYRPAGDSRRSEFHRVEVRMRRPGLVPRNVHGYYP